MGVGKKIVSGLAVAVIVAAGGYLVLDAYDIVPGYLTLAPVPDPPHPFPTPPGGVNTAAEVVTLGGPDPAAPAVAADIGAAVATIAADSHRLGDRVGVVVADAITGEILGSSAASEPFIPASTLKLLTAVAAGAELDLAQTLKTTAYSDTSGTVTLVGGGDMMLAAGYGDQNAVSGRAGLADLADQTVNALRLEGTTDVRLVLDDSLFDADGSSVWDPNTAASGWAAPVSAIAVDTGRQSEGTYAPRYADPARQAADVFAAALTERGITVTGVTRGTAGTNAVSVGEVESAPIGAIVSYAMVDSDNTITEVLGRLVAIEAELPASFSGATAAVTVAIAGLGIDTTGLVMADCSGLADGTLVAPLTLVETAQVLLGPSHPEYREIALGLPIGGLSGTLADRFVDSPISGLVRAKTGSLSTVKSLAGTVTTAGQRQLIFVVMADAAPTAPWVNRAAIDEFVTAIAS